MTEVIQPENLLKFVKEEFDLLPLRTQTWFELAECSITDIVCLAIDETPRVLGMS